MHGQRDVAVHEPALDGEVERVADDEVGLVDGLGGEGLSAATAGCEEMLVEIVEVLGTKAVEGDVADVGAQVVLDHPLVAVGGRRPDVCSLARKPRLGEEETELVGSASGAAVASRVGFETTGEELGAVEGVAGGMPAPSLPAVDGVDAVVGDDVEAVLAMHDVGHEPVIDDEGANPKRMSS